MVKQTPEMKPRQSLREVGKFGVAALIGAGAILAITQFGMPPDEEKLSSRELVCEFPIKETPAKFGSTVLDIVEKQVKFGPVVTAIDVVNSGKVEGYNVSTGGASAYTMESAGLLSTDILVRTPASCHWTKK